MTQRLLSPVLTAAVAEATARRPISCSISMQADGNVVEGFGAVMQVGDKMLKRRCNAAIGCFASKCDIATVGYRRKCVAHRGLVHLRTL